MVDGKEGKGKVIERGSVGEGWEREKKGGGRGKKIKTLEIFRKFLRIALEKTIFVNAPSHPNNLEISL